ncbi:MAG: serine/threonine protein kinase with repeat [Acidobacteria bacterium]|nr:serine/threonine protein kinase with repeat [Acidobacteriota bacterium]
MSAEEARATFGVTLAVTGTAISDETGLRLLLQLVDASTPNRPRQLDSRDLRGVAALETDCLIKIAEMLDVQLHPRDFSLLAAGGTKLVDASTLYLEGRGNLLHYDMPGKIDRAVELFRNSIAEDPSYVLAHAALAEAYWRQYDATKDVTWLDQAERSSSRALALSQELPAVHISRGLIDAGRGKYEAAVADYLHALEIDPLSYEALQGLAGTYERLNKPDLAEETFKKAIQLRPDLWTCYNLLGAFYVRHGRYQDAAAQYQTVVEMAPESIWGYNNLGAANLYLGRRSEAAALFEKADSIRPDYSARSNLGRLYFDEGRFAEAAQMFARALEINPRSRALMGNLASAYYWSGQREKAREAYRSAVEMTQAELRVNPNEAHNLSQLAIYHAMLGERSLALSELAKAVKLAPAETNVLYNAAQTYEDLGERDKALDWLGKALRAGYSKELVERSPGMKELRGDPRYARLIEDLIPKK